MPGIKHLIECHCYLAIYKNNSIPINHKFPVYSKINEDNVVIKKNVKCNNCEAFHHVYDLCKSEIKAGKDQSSLIISKEDIAAMLPNEIVNFLTSNNCDISIWEHIKDIIDEKRWEEQVVIKRDIIDEKQQIKYIKITRNKNIKVSLAVIDDLILPE
jgi:hypothetical protein